MATGYSRQSASQIAPGNTITDTGLEAEFDAIVSAFNSATGHSHDGTAGGGALVSLTSSVTGTLPVNKGGTNAITASAARTSLGLVIGTDVQAWSTHLDAVAALSKTDGNFIVTNGTTFVAESGATARASLGLTISTHVQAWSTHLDAVAALSKTDGNFIVTDGTTFVAESGATACTSLGAPRLAASTNTFTGLQAVSVSVAGTTNANVNSAPLSITNTAAGSGTSPIGLDVYWNTTLGVNDDYEVIRYLFNNASGIAKVGATLRTEIITATNGSEDVTWDFSTMRSGVLAERGYIGHGLVMGGASGGDKGAGTVNAVAVYDDNVLLTDYVFDHYLGRETELYASQKMQDKSDLFDTHAFDLEWYTQHWKTHGSLMGMPSQEQFYDQGMSIGDLAQRLWETVEVQAVHIHQLNERLKLQEAAKKCECN